MYIGRFAPSPTGPLHLGSLLAAVISYLDAKSNSGKWLVRIEDIDPPRELPGAADDILSTLEAHHLLWDGPVIYQSKRHEAYQEAIDRLLTQKAIYPCQCSRKQLAKFSQIHPDHCIQPLDATQPFAYRAYPSSFQYNDLYQGNQSGRDGHFVVKRRDQLFAYQLAVVVDDHAQHISHVIRGHDLMDSTPKQLVLYDALGFKPPVFGHFPVIVGDNGQKLSKQNLAPAIDNARAHQNLRLIFKLLGYKNTAEMPLEVLSIDALLEWGIAQWKTHKPALLHQQQIHPDQIKS
jgi:glutamyl-Q tRNA(Asp) synthetase